MKLPAVAIAAAFACGIALGLHPAVARHASSFDFASHFLVLAMALLVLGRNPSSQVWTDCSLLLLLPFSAGYCLDSLVLASRSSRGLRTTFVHSWKEGASI